MKRICSRCGAENLETYLYCIKCQSALPSITKLKLLRERGLKFYNVRDYRKAYECFKDYLNSSAGDIEILLVYSIVSKQLGLFEDMRNAYDNAGFKYHTGVCRRCRGGGRCTLCGGTKLCSMCDNLRHCTICRGTGICPKCQATATQATTTLNCSMCNGTTKCKRCNGSGTCSYCKGYGVCGECRGTGKCIDCGGTGYYIELEPMSVPETYRHYLFRLKE